MARLARSKDSLSNRFSTVYDAASRPVATINERGFRTTSTYDKVDRLVQKTNPLLQSTSYKFDAASRQVQRVDARGFPTTYAYDRADREKVRYYPDGTRYTFAYDTTSNRILAQDSTGVYSWIYDGVNRVISSVDAFSARLQYVYDPLGQRRRMIDPAGGLTTTVYDADRRLTALRNPLGELTTFVYDAAAREIDKTRADGSRTTMIYDLAGQQTRVANLSATGDTLSQYDYQFDPVGDRTSVVEPDTAMRFWVYDCRRWLDSENAWFGSFTSWACLSVPEWYELTVEGWYLLPVSGCPTGEVMNLYDYDATGNRLVRVDEVEGNTTTSTYDGANRLLTAEDDTGITTFTYDANGNRFTSEDPSGDITTYTWDFENRLVQVEHPDGGIVTSKFDPDDHRVQQDDEGTIEQFVYDGNNRLQIRDDTGTVETAFTYIPKEYAVFVSQHWDGESSFYLTSGIHDVTGLTDATGTVTDTYARDAFGVSVSSTGSTDNDLIYKGEVGYQETPQFSAGDSVFYLGISPLSSLGVFLRPDPAEADSNLYRPVKNNPVNDVDPSGLEEEEIDAADLPDWMKKSKYRNVYERLWAADPLVFDFIALYEIKIVSEPTPKTYFERSERWLAPDSYTLDKNGFQVKARDSLFETVKVLIDIIRHHPSFKKWVEKTGRTPPIQDRLVNPNPSYTDQLRIEKMDFDDYLDWAKVAGAKPSEISKLQSDFENNRLKRALLEWGGAVHDAVMAYGAMKLHARETQNQHRGILKRNKDLGENSAIGKSSVRKELKQNQKQRQRPTDKDSVESDVAPSKVVTPEAAPAIRRARDAVILAEDVEYQTLYKGLTPDQKTRIVDKGIGYHPDDFVPDTSGKIHGADFATSSTVAGDYAYRGGGAQIVKVPRKTWNELVEKGLIVDDPNMIGGKSVTIKAEAFERLNREATFEHLADPDTFRYYQLFGNPPRPKP